MSEQEVDVDGVNELIHEHGKKISWGEKVGLTTALLAVFAALSSLASTHLSDLAILDRVKSSDQWSYYQAKGIKSMLAPSPQEKARYLSEQEKIRSDAEGLTEHSEHSMHTHEFFAFAVTIFQVATAIGAIAVLIRKRVFWYTSLVLGAVGIAFIVRALLLLNG